MVECPEIDQWRSGPERCQKLEGPRASAVEDRDQVRRVRQWPRERRGHRKRDGLLCQRQAAFGGPERERLHLPPIQAGPGERVPLRRQIDIAVHLASEPGQRRGRRVVYVIWPQHLKLRCGVRGLHVCRNGRRVRVNQPAKKVRVRVAVEVRIVVRVRECGQRAPEGCNRSRRSVRVIEGHAAARH